MSLSNICMYVFIKVDDIPLETIAKECKEAESLLSEQINWTQGLKV